MKKEVAVLGGGLAGLSAGIMMQRLGYHVVLVEKKVYPFHKVCGEYLSLESEMLLEWLGFSLEKQFIPRLNQIKISEPQGKYYTGKLPLGGLGISRFLLDSELKKIFENEGGQVLDGTKVTDVKSMPDSFEIQTDHSQFSNIQVKVAFGAFGRNKPRIFNAETKPQKGFIGVKRHVKADIPLNQIELHHFPGGYCGISAVENGAYCFCYLLDERISKDQKGNLEVIEQKYLFQNPYLKRYLTEFEPITERVSTSGVMFENRPLSENGLLYLGDSAGMIPPLAGNGMSMALHSSVLAVENALPFLQGKITKEEMAKFYEGSWKSNFYTRLQMAKRLQKIMENARFTRFTIQAFQFLPGLFSLSARLTHGKQIPLPGSIR